jgi:hypothetical protein
VLLLLMKRILLHHWRQGIGGVEWGQGAWSRPPSRPNPTAFRRTAAAPPSGAGLCMCVCMFLCLWLCVVVVVRACYRPLILPPASGGPSMVRLGTEPRASCACCRGCEPGHRVCTRAAWAQGWLIIHSSQTVVCMLPVCSIVVSCTCYRPRGPCSAANRRPRGLSPLTWPCPGGKGRAGRRNWGIRGHSSHSSTRGRLQVRKRCRV